MSNHFIPLRFNFSITRNSDHLFLALFQFDYQLPVVLLAHFVCIFPIFSGWFLPVNCQPDLIWDSLGFILQTCCCFIILLCQHIKHLSRIHQKWLILSLFRRIQALLLNLIPRLTCLVGYTVFSLESYIPTLCLGTLNCPLGCCHQILFQKIEPSHSTFSYMIIR